MYEHRVTIDGIEFKCPSSVWNLSFEKCRKMALADSISERVSIALKIPTANLPKENIGRLYELLIFLQDDPGIIPIQYSHAIPNIASWGKHRIRNVDLLFTAYQREPALAFPLVTEALEQPKDHYIEVGVQAFFFIKWFRARRNKDQGFWEKLSSRVLAMKRGTGIPSFKTV